jgi:ubiquinone/menaquinone biosynthesis C-methylase UbiE
MRWCGARRIELAELLDGEIVDDETRLRALRDVARANAVFGGARAALSELWTVLGPQSPAASLLDVGTGAGDIAALASRHARARGVALDVIGIDLSPVLAKFAAGAGTPTVCGDALALPFADKSVDVVVCSQLLHHFTDDAAGDVIRELDRVARQRVIVSDLRRSWFAAAGFWLLSFPLRFHTVSRHDGVVSVCRAFTPGELRRLVAESVSERPRVRKRLGYRLTASWAPAEGKWKGDR